MTDPSNSFVVELPGGGTMHLLTSEEVELFEQASKRYREDYALTKMNDLILVGAILTQTLVMYRAQQRLSGMEPEIDAQGHPTGRYRRIEKQKAADLSVAQGTITKCAEEIRALEKALGVDKKTREAGGQHTVANYVTTLKRAAHQYGVRVTERVKEYEKFNMELRWKLRLLKNGDAEDKAYHDITPEKICEWAEAQLAEIEAKDKAWAKDKGKLFQGKL